MQMSVVVGMETSGFIALFLFAFVSPNGLGSLVAETMGWHIVCATGKYRLRHFEIRYFFTFCNLCTMGCEVRYCMFDDRQETRGRDSSQNWPKSTEKLTAAMTQVAPFRHRN
ncbi:hypothetical protein AVEN_34000-1 [Araneus ventricosus]|uniref:Uncharacterized protein n=1 Tax=Araneus ventricosus TaxID=182803 RepID=A0A4Y2E4E2_ARAVE|nr:hypothetical protein AVEN_34000-1 [Araneus ventricosus]